MEIKKAEMLFIELRDYLAKLGDQDLSIQMKNASDAVYYIGQADTDAERKEIIKRFYRYLYPARGGLTDVVIWDNDFETRVALNKPLERIRKELWEIVNRL